MASRQLSNILEILLALLFMLQVESLIMLKETSSYLRLGTLTHLLEAPAIQSYSRFNFKFFSLPMTVLIWLNQPLDD